MGPSSILLEIWNRFQIDYDQQRVSSRMQREACYVDSCSFDGIQGIPGEMNGLRIEESEEEGESQRIPPHTFHKSSNRLGSAPLTSSTSSVINESVFNTHGYTITHNTQGVATSYHHSGSTTVYSDIFQCPEVPSSLPLPMTLDGQYPPALLSSSCPAADFSDFSLFHLRHFSSLSSGGNVVGIDRQEQEEQVEHKERKERNMSCNNEPIFLPISLPPTLSSYQHSWDHSKPVSGDGDSNNDCNNNSDSDSQNNDTGKSNEMTKKYNSHKHHRENRTKVGAITENEVKSSLFSPSESLAMVVQPSSSLSLLSSYPRSSPAPLAPPPLSRHLPLPFPLSLSTFPFDSHQDLVFFSESEPTVPPLVVLKSNQPSTSLALPQDKNGMTDEMKGEGEEKGEEKEEEKEKGVEYETFVTS